MTAKDMLAEVLRRAVLTDRERESFTDMWDRIHRYNRCSDKQKAWIEKVYFGQKLEQAAPAARRRVVVPTWQKGSPREAHRAPEPAPRASGDSAVEMAHQAVAHPAVSRPTVMQPRTSRKSGTFMMTPRAEEMQSHQVGYINYPGVNGEVLVTSLTVLEDVCPRIARGSRQYLKIAAFFQRGGMVLKVKPLAATQRVA